jgi:hypothetical protein
MTDDATYPSPSQRTDISPRLTGLIAVWLDPPNPAGDSEDAAEWLIGQSLQLQATWPAARLGCVLVARESDGGIAVEYEELHTDKPGPLDLDCAHVLHADVMRDLHGFLDHDAVDRSVFRDCLRPRAERDDN